MAHPWNARSELALAAHAFCSGEFRLSPQHGGSAVAQ